MTDRTRVERPHLTVGAIQHDLAQVEATFINYPAEALGYLRSADRRLRELSRQLHELKLAQQRTEP